jgi:hypothetical protein
VHTDPTVAIHRTLGGDRRPQDAEIARRADGTVGIVPQRVVRSSSARTAGCATGPGESRVAHTVLNVVGHGWRGSVGRALIEDSSPAPGVWGARGARGIFNPLIPPATIAGRCIGALDRGHCIRSAWKLNVSTRAHVVFRALGARRTNANKPRSTHTISRAVCSRRRQCVGGTRCRHPIQTQFPGDALNASDRISGELQARFANAIAGSSRPGG